MSVMDIEDTNDSKQLSIMDSDSDSDSDLDKPKKKKKRDTKPTCRLCKNHNLKVRSKYHKDHCLGQFCICELCPVKKDGRRESKDQTKRSRAEKNAIKREKRKTKYQYELVDPKKPIPHFVIPATYKAKLYADPNIDKAILEKVEFKKSEKTEVIIEQKEKRQKLHEEKKSINEKSSQRITIPTNNLKDILRCTMCCLMGYDVRFIPSTVLPLIDELIAIIFQSIRESAEKSSDETKNDILLASIIRHMKIIRRTITWIVISLYIINVHLIYYLLPFIYCLFPT